MAKPKTQLTAASVPAFLSAIKDEQVRKDCRAIATIMKGATKVSGRMWGSSIVEIGRASCRERVSYSV